MPEIPIRCFIASVIALRKTPSGYQVLLLRRAQTLVGEWCQIAGKIEEDEAAWETGLRELLEETKLSPIAYFSADICEQFYEASRDAITLAPVFIAYIDNTAQVVINEEHSECHWAGFSEAIEMVSFGGQRKVLRHVEEEFVHRKPNKHLSIEIPAKYQR